MPFKICSPDMCMKLLPVLHICKKNVFYSKYMISNLIEPMY